MWKRKPTQMRKGNADVTNQVKNVATSARSGQPASFTAHPPDRYRGTGTGMGTGTWVVLLGAGTAYNTTINPSESTERLSNAVDS